MSAMAVNSGTRATRQQRSRHEQISEQLLKCAGASFGGNEEVGLAPTVKLHRLWVLFPRTAAHCAPGGTWIEPFPGIGNIPKLLGGGSGEE
jgi:hypothetical protein